MEEAVSIVLRFAVWFGLIPYLLLTGRGRSRLDRFVMGLLAAMTVATVEAQVLSALGLWEAISAWGTIGAIVIVTAVRRTAGVDWSGKLIRGLETTEEGGTGELRNLIVKGKGTARRGRRTPIRERVAANRDAAGWVLGAVVLAGAIFLLFNNVVRHYYLPASESYQHLAWVKYLQKSPLSAGHPTHIYQDGVYPYGYHAFISALSTLNFLDPFVVLSFAGPLAGLLLLLSAGYASYRLAGRAATAVLSVGVLAAGYLGSGISGASRMISPLPAEFGAVFALPSLVSAWNYLGAQDRDQGLMAVLAAFLTAAIAPWAFGYLALALIFLFITARAARLASGKAIGRLSLWMIGAAAVTAAPLLVSHFVLGMPFYASLTPWGPAKGILTAGGGSTTGLWISAPFAYVGLAIGVLLLGEGSLLWRQGERERSPLAVAMGAMIVVTYLLSGAWAGPLFVDPSLAGLIFALFVAFGAGLSLDLTMDMVQSSNRWRTVTAAVLIVAGVLLWRPVPAMPLGQYEYDDEAKAYLSIVHLARRWDWTIISTQAALPKVLGYGFHTQILEFARSYSYDQIQEPDFRMATKDTGDYFIFIEKIPLGSTEPVKPDARMPFPVGPNLGATTVGYYENATARAAIEARVWGFVEEYRAIHPDLVSVLVDSPKLRVYQVTHKGF